MSSQSRTVTLDRLAEILRVRSAEGRILVAMAGPPGCGKSTCAEGLVESLNAEAPGSAMVFPMDGYHYDDQVLLERGLRSRKGAPETFDVAGLAHMLKRLRRNEEAEIAVPVFDRDLEISRAAARMIPRTVRIIIVEGNYLLLDRHPWAGLVPLFDVRVMIRTPAEVLRERLIARWEGFGLPPGEVATKVEGNDLPNGRLVISDSIEAELEVVT